MLRFSTCIATFFIVFAIHPGNLHAEEAAEVSMPPPQVAAHLSVQSTDRFQNRPVEAEVFIDYKLVGKTPFEVDLEPGVHDLRVAADGYEPFVRRLTLDPKQMLPIHAQFDAGDGSVEFQASVPGAELIINRANPMMLPIRIGDLPEGVHSWEISAIGYEPHKGKLEFEKGRNLFIYTEMTSSAGVAEFESSPEGADIYMDSRDDGSIGQTPLRLEDVDADDHMVLLSKKGYATVLRSMDTSLGNKGDVHAAMSKSGAEVTIRTSVPGSQIYLRGFKIGEGSRTSIEKLEEGIYDISIRSDSHKPIYTEIHIPNKGRLLYDAELVGKESPEVSKLHVRTPLLERWYFWAGVGGVATASGVTGFLAYLSLQPEPAEKGDVIVPLP
jgi:hypothetical protein